MIIVIQDKKYIPKCFIDNPKVLERCLRSVVKWTKDIEYEIVVVKLGYLFEELKPYADRELFALSDGASCVELARLNLQRIARPMYPLEDFEWIAQ